MTSVAIVGYGSIAEEHARAIAELAAGPAHPDLRVTNVVGPCLDAAEAFARTFGVGRVGRLFDELLDDDGIDAVVICSPTALHAEHAAAALQAGKHVLCEIPLATSLADTDRLIGLARTAGRWLMVCHTQRYFAGLIEMRRRIAEGRLRPRALVCRALWLRRENVNWRGRRRSWTDDLLWHHGCHVVDTALWLLGADAAEVAGKIAAPSAPLGIPMDLAMVLRTARDELVSVAMSYNSAISATDTLLIADETTLLWTADGELRDAEHVLVDAAMGSQRAAITRQDDEFFTAVAAHREPASSARAVRPAMAVLQAVQDGTDR